MYILIYDVSEPEVLLECISLIRMPPVCLTRRLLRAYLSLERSLVQYDAKVTQGIDLVSTLVETKSPIIWIGTCP